jgi:hypothetical protein
MTVVVAAAEALLFRLLLLFLVFLFIRSLFTLPTAANSARKLVRRDTGTCFFSIS